MTEGSTNPARSSNAVRMWADDNGIHWSDGSRIYRSGQVLSEATPLVHTAGSPDIQAGPRARFLDGSRGSVRKPHEPLRQQRQLGVIGTVSVSALNMAHHALLAAFDLVREMVESRRRVDAEAGQGEGVGVSGVDRFWEGVRGLKR